MWPVRPNPGTNRAYQAGIDRTDGTLAKFTAVCAPMVYRGDRLPAELYGNAFVADPPATSSAVSCSTTMGRRCGRARRTRTRSSWHRRTSVFGRCTSRTRRTARSYVVDFYRGIIQDRASTTVYLRDHIISRKLDQPTGLGRIYRVVHETHTSSTDTAPFANATPAQLVEALSHPNGWRRDTAQRLLVERYAKPVAPALAKLAETAADYRTRLHALWTLDGIDSLDPATVVKAFGDSSRDVRASAIRLAEKWLGTANHPIQAEVLKRLDDSDWSVREQLAASLGTLPAGSRETAIASLLERYATDPIVVDAALSGLRGSEAAVLENVMASTAQTPQREAAVTMLAATIVRGGQDAAVQKLLQGLADDGQPAWQRSRCPSREPRSQCSVRRCRGHPLDAADHRQRRTRHARRVRAVALAQAAHTRSNGQPAAPGGGRGGGGTRVVRLNSEPSAFSTLAARTDDLGTRAARVLARVEWPGKPGASAPLAPLTAEEQQRFEAGRDVYKNICQACHQPDGRGQDRVAPSLIGSALALASPDIPARILLNGKEGPIGLMPPVGSVLSDDQIAGVLTYVRREWGQPGSAVDPATVKSVRDLTSGRTKPWTNDELLALAGGRGQRP